MLASSRVMLSRNQSTSGLVNVPDKRCLECSTTFADISLLFDHVRDRHNPNATYICACSFRCHTTHDYNRHQRQNRQIIGDQGMVYCLNTEEPANIYITPDSAPLIFLTGKMNACIFSCLHRWFKPDGLLQHLQSVHAREIDIRIQCCSCETMYTLHEFRDHIGSQHDIVDIL
ncbi:unnamed protein product [Adineta steineri]|uniref:C2H2-type domain-containing protein n=1 Tax=Adineta steineri TaxID=433720 RepID=A0A815W3N6_9BILA|nr:unnamed protein product [Adineta steineri]CAF1538216.1 unnamed protein product [Adineta steineri]